MTSLTLHRDTLLARLQERALSTPQREAFRTLEGEVWTWEQWWRDSLHVAAALAATGVEVGDCVSILSANRPVWPIADVGILLGAAVSVGLYPTAAPAQVEEVLLDAGVTVAIACGDDQLAKLLAVRARLPALRAVIALDAAPAAQVLAWSAFLARGADYLADPAGRGVVAARAEQISPATPAAMIYTSGSTGRAKGARLSHRTLEASARSVARALSLTAEDRSVSFLPFSHAGERIFGHCTRMLTGMSAVLIPEAARVWEAARATSATVFGGMPRFFEKAADALRQAAAAAPESERPRWVLAETLGRQRSSLRQKGAAVPVDLETEWRAAVGVADPVVHAYFGNALRVATSGGAALSTPAAELLDAFGVTVLGAYGQTEHLCGTMNQPTHYAFDSVGVPMPGSDLRLASDGEILFRRSALTFDGYHGLPDDTSAAFTPDGEWLRTGDLGELGADGGLRITGRKKELIALSTGKKVAPLPIELALEADPFVAQAVCVGEGRSYLTALLTLRNSAAAEHARSRGMPAAAVAADPDVLASIGATVERVNSLLSRSEQIKRWHLLPHEFSFERGELTPTQKVRRAEVLRLHHASIVTLYS